MGNRKSILIFGVGQLQQSLIERCKLKGLFTVGIDPNSDATCKENVDAFEIIPGDDFNATLAIAKQYQISGLITAATDKPLVMMARVANELNLPFYSEDIARLSTDKLLMKQKFIEASINCAKGLTISNIDELSESGLPFPVIIKPRDNSGSRGVIYCSDIASTQHAVTEALQFTKQDNVLVEEYIEGKEYSIESIHYNGEHHVIQITQKTTTNLPYNVELGHTQPADISIEQRTEIIELIKKVAVALGFKNCASHTEIKINPQEIYVIEASPRLGGDYITSSLVPLSTGINIEDLLIDISIGEEINSVDLMPKHNMAVAIRYLQLPEGTIIKNNRLDELAKIEGIYSYSFGLSPGDIVKKITNSLNRYGYLIYQNKTLENIKIKISEIEKRIIDML